MRLISRRVFDLLRRIPLTLVLATAILVTTAVTGTLVRPISPQQLESWGFGGYHPSPIRLMLAPFQILHPSMALSLIPAVLVFVGACEWRLRTRRTVLVCIATHVIGYTGNAVLLRAFAGAGSAWARSLVVQRDVGASNGAMGALGAFLAFLPRGPRRLGMALVTLYLVVAFAGEAHIWDVSHLISFVAGIVAGAAMLWRDERRWPWLHRDFRLDRIDRRRIVAWITMTIGVVDILTPFVLPNHPGFARFASMVPVDNPYWSQHLVLALGAVLLLAAPALGRGRRAARALSLWFVLVSAAFQWQSGVPGVEHVLSVLLLAALVLWRRDFRAPGDPPSVRAGLRALAGSALVMLLYAGLGFYVLRDHYHPRFTAHEAVNETVSRLLFAPGTVHNFHEGVGRWFLASIPLVGWAGPAIALAHLARAALASAKRMVKNT